MAHRPRFDRICDDAKSQIHEVSAIDASHAVAGGAILIDVREASEFQKNCAARAVNLSKGRIEMMIEEQVPDPTAAIVCYCGGGNRSALVVDNLQKMGYQNVRSLAGGFEAWKAAGLPIESRHLTIAHLRFL